MLLAVPEGIDRVTVGTRRSHVELPWASRALLAEIRHLESAAGIVKAFTDAGASRPVTPDDEQRAACSGCWRCGRTG